jgi:hypothetical protein
MTKKGALYDDFGHISSYKAIWAASINEKIYPALGLRRPFWMSDFKDNGSGSKDNGSSLNGDGG